MEVPCVFKSTFAITTCFITNELSYTCIPSATYIYDQDKVVREFFGVHEPGKSNKDVTAIIFKNVELKSIPRGILKNFPNLKSLEMGSCNLKSLSRRDLFYLRDIKLISLRLEGVEELPTDLFAELENVKRVFLFGDLSQGVAPKLLRSITRQNPFVQMNCQCIYELYSFDYYDSYNTPEGMYIRIQITTECKIKEVYNPPTLLSSCEDFLTKNLKHLNVPEILELGQTIHSKELIDASEIYIKRKYPEVDWDESTLKNTDEVLAVIEHTLKRRKRNKFLVMLSDCFKCMRIN